jgi:restriction endonuclease S subunit
VRFARHKQYKRTGIDWLPEAPDRWRVSRSDGIVSTDRTQLGPEAFIGRDVFHYSIPAVQERGTGQVENGDRLASTKQVVTKPVVLISKLNPRKATICIAQPQPDTLTLCSTEFVALNADQCELRFLDYLVRSELFRQLLDSKVQSVTRSHQRAKPDDIYKFWNAWPHAEEQRSIVDFLDRETARLDRLVGKKRELIEKLKEKRTTLISRTVTRGLNPNVKFKPSGIEWLGDIPEGWEVKKLSWLFRYCKGPNAATLTKEYVATNTGDFPVFSGQTENEGLMGRIDDYAFDFAAPVILVTTVGARAMTTRLVSSKFSLSQNCALIIPRMANLSVAYYNGVLRRLFDFERRSISLIMQPSLRFEDLHKFRVPRPPLSEQRAIADYIDRETVKLAGMMAKVEAAIEKLQEYRSALITAAVTGKIDVRNSASAAHPSHDPH